MIYCLFNHYAIICLFSVFRQGELYYGDLFIEDDNKVNAFVHKTRNPSLNVRFKYLFCNIAKKYRSTSPQPLR